MGGGRRDKGRRGGGEVGGRKGRGRGGGCLGTDREKVGKERKEGIRAGVRVGGRD